jgi:hypothetical protein
LFCTQDGPAEPIDLSKLSLKQLEALQDILRTLPGENPTSIATKRSRKAVRPPPTVDEDGTWSSADCARESAPVDLWPLGRNRARS